MRSGWRECILSWGECEEKENQLWTISTVASKVAAFPQNRQKMFTDATNLATMGILPCTHVHTGPRKSKK